MLRRIPILLYHSVSRHATPRFRRWTVTPQAFAEQMAFLDDAGYTPLPVGVLVATMFRPDLRLPEKPVAITFDDGFADFHEQALPVLEAHGFPSTLYVTTGYVGQTATWLARDGEGKRQMLSWSQLAEAALHGVEVGAHSHTHPKLDELHPTVARAEISRSKALLEDRLGLPVTSFAYPHGYVSRTVRRLVEGAGFGSACAVRHAMSSPRDDVLALARVIVSGSPRASLFERLLQGRGLPTAPHPEYLKTKAWRAARRTARVLAGAQGGRR